MSNWVKPKFSASAVNKAGRRIGEGNPDIDDFAIIENWRTSHAYILNTFQATLRNKSKGQDIIVAQRLKRRPTIFGKLQRYPTMQLSRMHDIAGCRVIFPTIESLLAYRTSIHRARFSHKRKASEEDRWNYLIHPKNSGYRGIHDVYEYKAKVSGGAPWDGLALELQYRTQVQHAWSTAVEVASLITHSNPKFNQGSLELLDFFKASSEILARAFEGATSCFPSLSNSDVIEILEHTDQATGILRLFSQIGTVQNDVQTRRKNTILILHTARTILDEPIELEISTFDNIYDAIDEYDILEKKFEGLADVVLVRADSMESIQFAYRNYFGDTTEFTMLLRDGRSILTD